LTDLKDILKNAAVDLWINLDTFYPSFEVDIKILLSHFQQKLEI